MVARPLKFGHDDDRERLFWSWRPFDCDESCSDEQVLPWWWLREWVESIAMMIAKERVLWRQWSCKGASSTAMMIANDWIDAMIIGNEEGRPWRWSHERLTPVVMMIANGQTVWLRQSLHERNNQQVRSQRLSRVWAMALIMSEKNLQDLNKRSMASIATMFARANDRNNRWRWWSPERKQKQK